MNSNLFIIWDFDAAIGQINSTYPYNFHEETIYKEIMNVESILKLSDKLIQSLSHDFKIIIRI